MRAKSSAESFSSPSIRIISSLKRSFCLFSASRFAFFIAKVIIVANIPPDIDADDKIIGSSSPNNSKKFKAGISDYRGSQKIPLLSDLSFLSVSSSSLFICLTMLFAYTLPAAQSKPCVTPA